MKSFMALQRAIAAAALFNAPAAWAGEPSAMGMIGLTRDQVARLNLFHDADVAGGVCPGIVEIVDPSGKVLATSRVDLMPGTGVFFDYDLAKGLRQAARLQFHVTVRTRPDHPGGANLEIYDRRTGKTQVVVTPTIVLDPSLVPQ